MTMKLIAFAGGWEGHDPKSFCIWLQQLLADDDVEITINDSLAMLANIEAMREFDVIIPIWSSARSSHQEDFGNISREEEQGLLQVVAEGCGLAGWHGHMGDAFRDHPSYHFMIGGQFVAHPPGWPDNPVPSDDFIDYEVIIKHPHHEIVSGISSFMMHSEQYYMLIDPSNNVLASTIFSGEHLWWIDGVEIPVIWTRHWDKGRIFYNSIGHSIDCLNTPSVKEITRRGILWAGSGNRSTTTRKHHG